MRCSVALFPLLLALLDTYAAFRQDGDCQFPERWWGTWFQSGVRQPITIEGARLSTKGTCLAVDGDKFLVADDKRACFRCVVLHEKHSNVLQYKESLLVDAVAQLSVSTYRAAAIPLKYTVIQHECNKIKPYIGGVILSKKCYMKLPIHAVVDKIILKYNPNWCTVNYINVTNIGTSDFSLNSSTTVKHIPDNAVVTVILKRKTGNTYSVFGQKLQHEICDFIRTDKIVYENLVRYGNLPRNCPIEPNEYYVSKYRMNIGGMSSMLLPGVYRVDVLVQSGVEVGFIMHSDLRAVQNVIAATGRRANTAVQILKL